MEPLYIGAVLVVVGVLLGVLVALVRTRNATKDRISGLEPPPEAPRVPPEVRDEAQRTTQALWEAPLPESAPSVEDVIDEARGQAVAQPDVADPGVAAPDVVEPDTSAPDVAEPEAPARPRFRDRLSKARNKLAGVLGGVRGAKVDTETWDDIETALLSADVGLETTEALIEVLRTRAADELITEGDELLDALKQEMKARLVGVDLSLHDADELPTIWLFVGVNGVGKTTTIGKIGNHEASLGRSVVMAAGDTFRAAAAEQLAMWAERCGAELVRGNEGGDPSAVIYDAVEHAAASGAELVLADTAGRLHTKVNLMEELRKVRRVSDKGAGSVTEVLLVLDATTGQNGLVQAQQFTEAVDVTGVVLTKLDGSAKGGIVFAIQAQLGIPVKLVGLGEGAEDLVPFDSDEFVEALFA
jgi:fused signal recognition particle receptor